jgi:hypothetical protein
MIIKDGSGQVPLSKDGVAYYKSMSYAHYIFM